MAAECWKVLCTKIFVLRKNHPAMESLFVDKRAVNRVPHVVFHISDGFILHPK